MDKATKRRKGFCFIVFSDENSVAKACSNRYQVIQNKQVEVKKAVSRKLIGTSANPVAQTEHLQPYWPNLDFTHWVPQVYTAPSPRHRFSPYPLVGNPGPRDAQNQNTGLYPIQSLLQVAQSPYQVVSSNLLSQNGQLMSALPYYFSLSQLNPPK